MNARTANDAPTEYIRRGDESGLTAMFACTRCQAIHTPELRGGLTSEVNVERARQAAIDCSLCKSQRSDPKECDENHQEARARRIAAAKQVTDISHCFSDDGDAFYMDPADAADAGETGVFGARFTPFRIDFGDLMQTVIDGHHDDASEDDLEGIDDLAKAVEEFNNVQTGGSYEMDDKVWQGIAHRQTFAMIKPDATARGVEKDMIADIESAGFRVVQSRRQTLTRDQAEWLYREHRARDHFAGLVDYTISGEVVMLLLEGDGENVPADFRKLMGATDRTKADAGTLRAKYAIGYRENSIHGSDSPRAAIDEMIRFMR